MPLRDHRVFNRGRQAESGVKNEEIHDDIQRLYSKSTFDTAVVTEFISNPEEFLETSIEVDESSLRSSHRSKVRGGDRLKKTTMLEEITTGTKKVENPYMARLMPRNSIIAYNITDGKSQTSPDPEIFLPFFPAHFSMPVKPGEQVWVFYEMIGKKKVGYWLFRKTASIHVDDLNYTFLDRQAVVSNLLNIKDDPTTNISKGKFKTLVKNLAYKFQDVRQGGDGSGALRIDPINIIKDSISYDSEFLGEAVPRYSKKCSDLVLQGSNNTLISMSHQSEKESGIISFVVGRSLSATESEMVVKNTMDDSAKSLEHEELDKTKSLHSDKIIKDEGSIENFDASSARIDMSMADNGYIIAHAANNSFLKMNDGEIYLGRDIEFTSGVKRITINDDKIEMNEANEPYVIHSALKDILTSLQNQITQLSSLGTNLGLIYQNTTSAEFLAAGISAAAGQATAVTALAAMTSLKTLGPQLQSNVLQEATENLTVRINNLPSSTIFGS